MVKKFNMLICKVLSIFILISLFSFVNVKAEISYKRIGGSSRYDTCKLISDRYGNTFENIILVSGENFPDALCSAPLANKLNAPIIITNPQTLEKPAEETIKSKRVKRVVIIGNIISVEVENKIRKMGVECKRIGGRDRYETSVLVAKALGDFDKIAVVYGENYPDALSIAPIAANMKIPILLVKTNEVPDVVMNFIKGRKINNSYIIGSTGVIGESVKKVIPNSERIAGEDRYKTNLKVLSRFKYNLNVNFAYIASGTDFPDALSGSALAQKYNAPILLISENIDSNDAMAFQKNLENKKNIFVLGLEGAVSKLALYRIGVEKKPENPKPPEKPKPSEKPKPQVVEPPWTSSLNVFNTSQTNIVSIKKYASNSSPSVGYGYGGLQEVKILGSKENFYYIQALNYKTLNYINGYVEKKMVKTIRPSGPYNILVDKTKKRIYIFKNNKVFKEYICTIGANRTQTPSGRFLIGDKGYSFKTKGGAVCYYWTRFNNNYLFHSVLYDSNGYVIKSEYDKLGEKASHGCIRIPYYDAKWIYENVPLETLVTIKD